MFHWSVPLVAAVVLVVLLFVTYQSRHTVLYYAEWCGHCKKLMPVWDELEKELGSGQMQKIDCSKTQCAGISGYPTIIQYDGFQSKVYTGDRSRGALKNFILNSQL